MYLRFLWICLTLATNPQMQETVLIDSGLFFLPARIDIVT